MRKLIWGTLFLALATVTLCAASNGYCKTDTATPKLIKKSDKGKLYALNGVKMLVLSGTFSEMGRQYGALLGNEISGLYETAIEKSFIKNGLFSLEELNLFAASIFKTLPMRQKELIRGMSSASGLKQEKIVLAANIVTVQILARKKFGGNTNACTSVAVWGKYTNDEKTLTARNYDFPVIFRELAKDYAVIIVFKPSDGSNAVAGIGFAGTVSFIDALNDKGIYIEANNAADSAGLVMFNARTEATTQAVNILFDATDSTEFNALMNSTRFSYSAILMAADSSTAQYYEIASWDIHKRDSAGIPIIAAGNQFNDPAWGILSLPSPAAWYSSLRENNIINLVKSRRAAVDAKHMMAILDAPFYNEDGTVGTGVSVLKKNPKDDEVTVWQVVTHPASLEMWVRFPMLSNWIFIDLKKWFR